MKSSDKNQKMVLPLITMECGSKNFLFKLTRLQFPLKIAFTQTINKAQCQSTTKSGILLPQNVWTHGLIYVAL